MLRALLRSSHPGPTLAVTLITMALAIGVGLRWWQIVVITVMIAANQLSIGLSNDWLDAARDRRNNRHDKPIASGEISGSIVARWAIGCAVASILLSLSLGTLAAIAHALFLSSGWLYNWGLKSTPVSVLPYVVGFGALPAIVTLAADRPQLAPGWAIAAAALLGVAAHVSNVLPDLDDDSATGVRGLPHRLGARPSSLVIAVSLMAASAIIVAGQGTPIAVLSIVALTLTTAIAIASVVLVLQNTMKRLLFRLTIAAAMINVALLLLSAPQLR